MKNQVNPEPIAIQHCTRFRLSYFQFEDWVMVDKLHHENKFSKREAFKI